MRTMALADELGLTGQSAFFGDWVPYEDWPSILIEADIGLSLHRDTVEARLAYRSRVLDYIWAGLPMVLTRGDATADLVTSYGLGLSVDYEDDAAVAHAIGRLLDEQGSAADTARRERFDAARRELTWESAAEPLIAFVSRRAGHPTRPGVGSLILRQRADPPTPAIAPTTVTT
jgi:glycosyltransferase involved in cell wall biosynthesis